MDAEVGSWGSWPAGAGVLSRSGPETWGEAGGVLAELGGG